MDDKTFDDLMNWLLDECRSTLSSKAGEYADKDVTDDRLHNFKVAAELTGQTPIQALGGFMAKHTVSIYDLIAKGEEAEPQYQENDEDSERLLDLWLEKIKDHLNYLILLYALVREQDVEEPPKFNSVIILENMLRINYEELLDCPAGDKRKKLIAERNELCQKLDLAKKLQ